MKNTPIQRLTITALLAALALALSFLEGLLPPLPVPGARFGLANVVVMAALAQLSFSCAAGITAAKSVFALLVRGPVACLMSTLGGALALLAMWAAYRFGKRWFSFIGVGVIGAAAHNIGQLLGAVAMLGSAMWYYTPILLLVSIPTGVVTGAVLNILYPHIRQFS